MHTHAPGQAESNADQGSRRQPVSDQARFWPLMIVAGMSLVIYPYSDMLFGPVLDTLLKGMLWVAGAYAMARHRPMLVAGALLALTTMVLHWMIASGTGPREPLIYAFHFSVLVMLLGTILYIVVHIWRVDTITGDTVLGGICIFLMFGMLFAALYSLTETVQPGSFRVPDDLPDPQNAMRWFPIEPPQLGEGAPARDANNGSSGAQVIYFSYTTLTTLGYGDISPRGEVAQALTNVQAVLGQLYVAVFIARLVASAAFMRRHRARDQ